MRVEGKVRWSPAARAGSVGASWRCSPPRGAAVVFTGRSEDAVAVEAGVKEAGGEVMYRPPTTASKRRSLGAVAATVERYGRLTTLVNNADRVPIYVGSGKDSHVDEIDNDTFDQILRIALMGTVWASKYALSETAPGGQRFDRDISREPSKSALSPTGPPTTRPKRHQRPHPGDGGDFGKDDIRTNAIIVGFIFTGSEAMSAILDNPQYRAAFEKNIMVPRFGEPADIAAGVVYLASDESKYVTGIELTIDGVLCHQALPELDFEGMRRGRVSGGRSARGAVPDPRRVGRPRRAGPGA